MPFSQLTLEREARLTQDNFYDDNKPNSKDMPLVSVGWLDIKNEDAFKQKFLKMVLDGLAEGKSQDEVKAIIKRQSITDEFVDEIFALVKDNQMEEGGINTSTKIKGSLWLREAFLKAQAYVTQRMTFKMFIFKVFLYMAVFSQS